MQLTISPRLTQCSHIEFVRSDKRGNNNKLFHEIKNNYIHHETVIVRIEKWWKPGLASPRPKKMHCLPVHNSATTKKQNKQRSRYQFPLWWWFISYALLNWAEQIIPIIFNHRFVEFLLIQLTAISVWQTLFHLYHFRPFFTFAVGEISHRRVCGCCPVESTAKISNITMYQR